MFQLSSSSSKKGLSAFLCGRVHSCIECNIRAECLFSSSTSLFAGYGLNSLFPARQIEVERALFDAIYKYIHQHIIQTFLSPFISDLMEASLLISPSGFFRAVISTEQSDTFSRHLKQPTSLKTPRLLKVNYFSSFWTFLQINSPRPEPVRTEAESGVPARQVRQDRTRCRPRL